MSGRGPDGGGGGVDDHTGDNGDHGCDG